MAIAAQYKLKVHQIDVVTAYLNAQLNKEVIMEIQEQMEEALEKVALNEEENLAIGRKVNEMLYSLRAGGNTCKLSKALYGLRQFGRQWHSKLNEKLRSLDLSPTKGDFMLIRGASWYRYSTAHIRRRYPNRIAGFKLDRGNITRSERRL